MRLFEHGDFANLVTAAARALERPEAFVEKDYYIAELLRIVAANYPQGEVVFKGGTSLSMAWRLIDRLSEDVDLLLAKDRFTPTLSRSRVDAELAGMTEAIGAHPAFTAEHVRRKRGFSRSDRFAYRQRFARAGIAGTIVSEPGVRGGATPSEACEISSDLGRFVREQGLGDIAEDTAPFSIAVLHFRRTFVEKLFIVHGLVDRLQVEGTPLGRDARHYIDLYELAGTEAVRQMIETSEYVEIAEDTNAIGVEHFGKDHRAPENLTVKVAPRSRPQAAITNTLSLSLSERGRATAWDSWRAT